MNLALREKGSITPANNISLTLRGRGIPTPVPAMFLERIEACKKTLRSNCIGTALYITGARSYDDFVSPAETYWMWLSGLGKIERPVLGCIAAWEKKDGNEIFVAHMGVVTSLHPLLMAERYETYGEFTENKPFPVIHREYNTPSYGPHKLSFYLPDALWPLTKVR